MNVRISLVDRTATSVMPRLASHAHNCFRSRSYACKVFGLHLALNSSTKRTIHSSNAIIQLTRVLAIHSDKSASARCAYASLRCRLSLIGSDNGGNSPNVAFIGWKLSPDVCV